MNLSVSNTHLRAPLAPLGALLHPPRTLGRVCTGCTPSTSNATVPTLSSPIDCIDLAALACSKPAGPPRRLIRLAEASAKGLAVLLSLILCITSQAKAAAAAILPGLQYSDNKGRRHLHQLRVAMSGARLLAVVVPFARAAATESLTSLYTRTFEKAAFGFAKMYLFSLFLRVLLSWFPSIDWNVQPWQFLRLITEPYLQIYRGILPPLFGQLDFTPLVGFLILQDVVELMSPSFTLGMHAADTSTRWTTSDVLCYFDGF